MKNTADTDAPYHEQAAATSLHARARQAIADGDQAAARALLHQLLVDQSATGLSATLTDAVVATAAASEEIAEHRARHRRLQRELVRCLAWLESAHLDLDELAQIRQRVDLRVAQLQHLAEQRAADERVAAADGVLRRRVGAGWLEAKLIPKPGGRQNGPYLYYRARANGRRRSIYIGKLSRSAP